MHFGNLTEDRRAGGHAEYTTPHLDKLSSEGVVLNDYYVDQLCSPTRTALMSSRYAYNLGLSNGVITNGHPVALRLNESTIAEHLKSVGYTTAAFGKWDIGYHTWHHTPTKRGFDSFLGYYDADEDYYKHTAGLGFCDTAPSPKCPGGIDFNKNTVGFNDSDVYSTYAYTSGIVAMIEEHAHGNGKPFFIYAAYQAVHGPLESPQRFIDACSAEGVREANRLIFCGMVKALDEGIGNITRSLETAGLSKSTLIGLTTDNGGQNGVGGNNWPLRGNKATIFEGGLRGTGFLWGAMLQQPGRRANNLMHLTDWGPTLFSAAGGDGAALARNATLKLNGVDQWGALSLIDGLNRTAPRTEVLLHLAGPDNNDASTWSSYSAYRIGPWKVVVAAPDKPSLPGGIVPSNALHGVTGWVRVDNTVNSTGRWFVKPTPDQVCDPGPCLFHLENDPLEKEDLSSSSDPDAKAALALLLNRIQSFNVTRVPNQKFDCDPKSCPTNFGGFWQPWLNATPPMPPIPPPKPKPLNISSSISTTFPSDGNGGYVLAGWVCDKTVEEKDADPSTVTISVDGSPAGTVVANGHRARLVSDKLCYDNQHGFVYHLDGTNVAKQAKATLTFSIVARSTGATVQLSSSPRCLCSGKPCTC